MSFLDRWNQNFRNNKSIAIFQHIENLSCIGKVNLTQLLQRETNFLRINLGCSGAVLQVFAHYIFTLDSILKAMKEKPKYFWI